MNLFIQNLLIQIPLVFLCILLGTFIGVEVNTNMLARWIRQWHRKGLTTEQILDKLNRRDSSGRE